MDIDKLDFDKGDGLLPAIIQDADTYQVLMLGYMNKPALEKTLEEERVTFYSRSKERLWTKGETSENYLDVVEIQADCDNDTLLILATPQGPTCHTGETSCFHEKKFVPKKNRYSFLKSLEDLIKDRKEKLPEDSYTTYLFNKGIDKIAQKVGEEAVETVIEAKNDSKKQFVGEVADLLFHLMVLMAEKGVSLKKVVKKLKKRHNKGNHKHLG
ncbi:bifunctional phosphoribosyl-AMP cyclohydrolase/phosphoribosyl-ATP diphosphatase HisIE [Aliifodinibius sp. S!AR15-10]|uniref:bifunctional phosphoribosyl-AMP cyclohydrolase/phosphoribosyl-ATP diphosphatase HisIE n=1 Tax=Aliifodinibius sp. S!AR15-10 TaxID=2950437 RepID=UPI002859B506|nr:bifunctional phosphoribosyl-AMP cyclohydrolase/phosphoribosyl-ATP diphosphatase HisIE [Aliifodinibius sp. S!AR15-10]MDR8392290.1 bifunctional phosphoribosyl-AMP cyclohydrolase/phosphoribosyl-ATP diphosphatase HisIE [Aliifodinibius sp. S!AR15-10]